MYSCVFYFSHFFDVLLHGVLQNTSKDIKNSSKLNASGSCTSALQLQRVLDSRLSLPRFTIGAKRSTHGDLVLTRNVPLTSSSRLVDKKKSFWSTLVLTHCQGSDKACQRLAERSFTKPKVHYHRRCRRRRQRLEVIFCPVRIKMTFLVRAVMFISDASLKMEYCECSRRTCGRLHSR